MTTTLQPAIRAGDRLGQGTAVEQSRAVAEVQAAIVVAQQCPRDIGRAVRDMQRSCAQKSLAERAFFRYSRAGSQITGPSVQLARELARCFGNVQYGLVELRRDDGYGQSEMLAFAWDVQTNTRSSTTFIVPHIRDTRNGAVTLTDMRDIYENNANNGARRLREMIFAILPGWYTEDAVAACYEALQVNGEDGTLAERTSRAVEGFAKLGVTVSQIEQKLGGPQSKWTPYDLAQLQVIYRSVMRNEVRIEDEFPAAAPADGRVTAAEITGKAPSGPVPEPSREDRQTAAAQALAAQTQAPGQPGSHPAAPEVAVPDGSGRITDRQRKDIERQQKRLGFEDHETEEWLAYVASAAGLQTAHLAEGLGALTQDQAKAALSVLGPAKDRPALVETLTSRHSGASTDSRDGGQPTLDGGAE